MKREPIKTEDGSMTLYVPELGEHYHSIHGAVTESEHIYIEAAFKHCSKESIRILEYGIGTGLNVLLTFLEAQKSMKKVYYHGIEKYPLTNKEFEVLNKSELPEYSHTAYTKIHECPWNKMVKLNESFSLYKEKSDFRDAKPDGPFDLIYFDAFSPDIQPELWTLNIFKSIYELASPGAILTTYTSKGTVKEKLRAAGFIIKRLPGPPGKRHIIRARKEI
ncbi:MAG: tRNA (5-methylaminomethyl-2-thiouridine)(34)-methyltransferase MnmD [Bacteroidales bacterium]|jgi:tRNA U34 5-methylaminomethyl-2-thiouridine-forming methyltransferase MnmC|nr:tRNA (5-methylaminomethyl-2-thiouridine)(34)-methyltransferase MnmD [Bacteroidales bacterium]